MKAFTIAALLFIITLPAALVAQGSYTHWETAPCMKGLDFRTIKTDNVNNGKREWRIQFRNRYQSKITFNYLINNKKEGRLSVSGGSGTISSYFFAGAYEDIYIQIGGVRFGKDDWGADYVGCDY